MSTNGEKETVSNGKEHVFDLESEAFASDHFRMNEFKVKRCPRARPHDWTQCPFAHPGEKARRRDPRRYRYSGTACPEFRKSGCCRRGDACPFAHGVFECWLHPSRYRTQLCTDGTACKRRVCFFAHIEKELRRPEDDPVAAERQVQAELAAEVQNLQQQHLTQALQALLLHSSNTTSAPNASNNNTSISPTVAMEALKQTSLPPPSVLLDSTENSTMALQNALMQKIKENETSLPESQSASETSNNNTQTQAAGLSTTKPLESSYTSSAASPVSNHGGGGGGVNVQNAVQILEEHIKQNPDNLNLLTQLLNTTNADGSASGVPTPEYYDPNAISQALVANNNYMNSTVMNNVLAQNALKAILSPARRSIDNSYLSGLTNAIAATTGFIPPTVSEEENGSSVQQAMTEQMETYQMPLTSEGYLQSNSENNSATVTPSEHSQTQSQQQQPSASSLESIQQLMQDPVIASNLSQMLQMNPELLSQVIMGSASTNSNSAARRSIDNAFLTRTLGTAATADMNGNVNMSNGTTAGLHLHHPQQQLQLQHQHQQGAAVNANLISQLAYMQQMNNGYAMSHHHQQPVTMIQQQQMQGIYHPNGTTTTATTTNNDNLHVESMIPGMDILKMHNFNGSYQSLIPVSNPQPASSMPQYNTNNSNNVTTAAQQQPMISSANSIGSGSINAQIESTASQIIAMSQASATAAEATNTTATSTTNDISSINMGVPQCITTSASTSIPSGVPITSSTSTSKQL